MENEKNKRKQNNNRKGVPIIVPVLIIVLIIVIIVIAINMKKDNNTETTASTEQGEKTALGYVEEIDGVKVNKSTKLNAAKDVNGLLITNIQLTSESGMTNLLADVTNNTGAKTEVKTVSITLLDEQGNELTTVTGILDELEVGETTQLNIAMTSNYVNAYDFIANVN